MARFTKGDTPWNKGVKYDEEMKSRMNTSGLELGHKRGKEHHLWKESDYGYHAVHKWIARQLDRPSMCEGCGTENAKKFEWANISGEYKRDTDDWIRLCTSCHRGLDNHAEKMWKTRRTHSASI